MPLNPDSQQKHLVNEVSALLHAGNLVEAAKIVAQRVGVKKPVETKAQCYEVLNVLLHWLLNNGAPEEAAQLLWGPTQFTAEPESARRVWQAFDTSNYILLMGAASMSKSYSMGVRLMLEWIRDPEYTTIKVIGPSENHLEDNLFTHLVQLHKGSSIPLPGLVGKLFIGLDARSRKGAIIGVVVPLGKKSAGRIQGTKRFPRKKEHPIFGRLSRMFIFLDEIANIPVGIWRDIDNVMANAQGDGGMKIIGAFNPTDQADEVGKRCEPPTGWPGFNSDEHFDWTSTRGWRVVRLDAKYSENVVRGEIVFSGLQTLEGFNLIIANSGGTDSPGYWSMARGCFPPTGVSMAVIPGGMLNKVKGEFIWHETPDEVAGVDLALKGKDNVAFAKGKFGRASGVKFPPSLLHPQGETIFYKDHRGRTTPRYALQLETIFRLPKADTIEMAQSIILLCQQLNVRPENVCLDQTGNGVGVVDAMKTLWSQQVRGVNFSESATEQKIMEEDTKTPKELYDRIQTELWFAMRKVIEFDYFKILPSMDITELSSQLSTRWFIATGKMSKVESKDDYQSRNHTKSPDEADGVSLMVHGVRVENSLVLGMTLPNKSADRSDEDEHGGEDYRVDVTNRFDDL